MPTTYDEIQRIKALSLADRLAGWASRKARLRELMAAGQAGSAETRQVVAELNTWWYALSATELNGELSPSLTPLAAPGISSTCSPPSAITPNRP